MNDGKADEAGQPNGGSNSGPHEVDPQFLESSFRHLPAAEVLDEFPPAHCLLLLDRVVPICDAAPDSIAVNSNVNVRLRQNKAGELVVVTNSEAVNERFPELRRKRRKIQQTDSTRFDLAKIPSEFAYEGELCTQIKHQQLTIASVRGPFMKVLPSRAVVVEFGLALVPDGSMLLQRQQTLALKLMAYALEDPSLVNPVPYTATPADLLHSITRSRESSANAPEFPIPGLRTSLMPYQRESVNWCLRREGKALNDNGQVEDLDPSIRDYVVAPALGWRKVGELWANPYVLRTSSQDPLPANTGPEYQGKGLLAEEMGLGKTVEMLSLVTLNSRPSKSFQELGALPKIGTTLVIVPRTILQQWVSEVKLHSPNLQTLVIEDPYTPINELAAVDVAFVTYNQLSRWFPYTSTQKKRQERSSRYQFEDVFGNEDALPKTTRRSTLIEVQFWRVVLDEVQMVHTGDSSAALTARRIPRVHAWAVSGTPVKNSLEDMRGITKFLDLHPFVEGPCWQRLIASPIDLDQSMRLVAMRHTRPLVADQLHLTTQHRKLILLKFSSVERLRYKRLLADFQEDAKSSNCNLSKWLLRLRQICSHTIAQPSQLAGNTVGNIGLGSQEVLALTLDQVLTQLVDEADSEVWTEQSKLINAEVELGQLLDKNDQLNLAIDTWKNVLEQVQAQLSAAADQIAVISRIHNEHKSKMEHIGASVQSADILEVEDEDFKDDGKSKYSDAEIFDARRNTVVSANRLKMFKQRQRSLEELLHRVYFFLGTGYFRSSQRLKLRVEKEEDLKSPENQHFLKENMKNEKEYYDLAEKVRIEILKEAESRVLELNKSYEPLQLVNTSKYCSSPKSKIVDNLGKFAREIVEELHKILGQPLMDEQHTKKQEELGAGVQAETDAYSKTLDLQEYAFVYLEILQVVFRDRAAAINGGNVQPSPSPQESGDAELALKLIERREEIIALLHYDREPLTSILRAAHAPVSVRNRLQGEVRECQERYSSMGNLYNARVDYYKQLQDLSDQVTDIDTGDKTDFSRLVQNKRAEISRVSHKIADKLRDQKYLRNMEGSNHSVSQKREEAPNETCTICLEPIVNGALTPCGHFFCVDCLHSWLHTRKTCPLCNRRLKFSEVRTFSTADSRVSSEPIADGQPGGDDANANDDNHASNLYLPISHRLYNQIHQIPLPRNYGVKIDMIVKHVLYLRSQDPTAQIVVFSQWVTMLKVLQTAFAENDIIYAVTSKSNVGINEFRTDSRVACLLLHAKADVAGLTLVNANHVFLCEPLMNTALELQAVSRINRIGQTRETFAWQFCVENTVEQTILGMTTKSRLLQTTDKTDMAEADSMALAEAPTRQMMDKSSGAEIIGDNKALRRILFKDHT